MRDLARALVARGHDVKLLSLGLPARIQSPVAFGPNFPPAFAPRNVDGVSILPIRPPRGRRLALAPLVWRGLPLIRRFAYGRALVPSAWWYARVLGPTISDLIDGVDVVEGFCSDLLAAATQRAARLKRIPLVLTPVAHRGEWGTDPSSARCYRTADAVLAMLDIDAELYREMGVATDRIHTVGVPVPSVQRGGGDALRKSRGIEGPLVVYMGRREVYKGVDVLLDAARGVEGTIALVGPGASLPADRPPNVLDIGPVETGERDAWLDAADLLVLPSSSETFGAVIAEAWSAETPVVTSRNPALRSLVESGRGGLSVSAEPHALSMAINSLLADSKQRAELGRAGHEYWKEHFTADAVAARREVLYEGLVAR
jgi:glycosyltransferase involved in cell wall biosynthesis